MTNITKDQFWGILNEPEPAITITNKYNIYRWYNDQGQIHRENDLPAVIWYHEDGSVFKKCWYQNGQEHRENDLPGEIFFRYNGEVMIERWVMYGKYTRQQIYLKSSLTN